MKKLVIMENFSGTKLLKDMRLKDAKRYLLDNFVYSNQIGFMRRGQVYYIDFWERNPKIKPFPKNTNLMIKSVLKED